MAKYKKRKDGRYATSILIGYTDEGKPKRKVLYGKTIQELEKKLADVRSLQNKGIVIDDNRLTVGEWSQTWLKLHKSDKAYNTYETYRNAVETHIIPVIGDIRLSALKAHHVQQLLNDIIHKGHQRAAEMVKLTISQIIKQAMIEEYIYKDITLGLSMPPKKKSAKRALTDNERQLIQRADLDIKERVFIDLMYYAGVRKGEALALTRGDIDFVNKKIKINKTLVMKSNKSEIKYSPKTNAGYREIPIPDILIKSLTELAGISSDMYLFTKQEGGLVTRSAFRRMWDNITDKFNVAAGGDKFKRTDRSYGTIAPVRLIADDITPHLFRHTYATNLYYAGIDIKTAQYLLGHSSIQVTMDIYTHLDNTRLETASEQLNNYFDSQNIVNG